MIRLPFSGKNEDLAAPVLGHLYSNVGRSAKPVKAQDPAFLDGGKPESPVPDDTGAQKRRGLCVGEAFRNGIGEIFGNDRVLGITPVGIQAGCLKIIAQVFVAPPAKIALTTA